MENKVVLTHTLNQVMFAFFLFDQGERDSRPSTELIATADRFWRPMNVVPRYYACVIYNPSHLADHFSPSDLGVHF